MPIGLILFFLFVAFPIIEIILLFRLSSLIGFLNVLTLAILTAFVGSYLMKNQGGGIMRTFKESLARGESPERALVDGVCILIAGALLITPGILSDTIGVTLLVPWSRAFISTILSNSIKKSKSGNFKFYSSHSQDENQYNQKEKESKIIDTSGERLD